MSKWKLLRCVFPWLPPCALCFGSDCIQSCSQLCLCFTVALPCPGVYSVQQAKPILSGHSFSFGKPVHTFVLKSKLNSFYQTSLLISFLSTQHSFWGSRKDFPCPGDLTPTPCLSHLPTLHVCPLPTGSLIHIRGHLCTFKTPFPALLRQHLAQVTHWLVILCDRLFTRPTDNCSSSRKSLILHLLEPVCFHCGSAQEMSVVSLGR